MLPLAPLPLDLLPLITDARQLPINEILQRCLVSKQFNQGLCHNKGFWKLVAEDRLTSNTDILDHITVNEVKHSLLDLDKISHLNVNDDEELISKLARRLGQKGYDRAILNADLPFYALAAAIRGATIGYHDDLVEQILAIPKSLRDRGSSSFPKVLSNIMIC